MFKFDDRYIIFAILSPGIYAIGLIYLLLNLCGIPIFISFNNGLIDIGFGAITSLLVGCLLWYANQKGKVVSKNRLSEVLKGIENETLLQPLGITLAQLKEKFQSDFKKDFIPTQGNNQLKELDSNFTDIYYGLDRVIELKTPSAVKLLREFLEQIIVAIHLLLIPYALGVIRSLMIYGWSDATITITILFILLFFASFLLRKTLYAKDKRFYTSLLDVYTANNYWNVITKDLKK